MAATINKSDLRPEVKEGDAKMLNIGIVGAGIAGLGAAIALSKAGHHVTLYEKSTFKREIGAAITMTPSANRILDTWHFDAKAAGETQKLQSRSIDSRTLECRSRLDLSDVPSHFDGHEFNAFHRVDLHEGLRKMAADHGAELQLGKEVVRVDCDGGILEFKDGSKEHLDLVVVADGIRSPFVSCISGADVASRSTGFSVFRTLIPMSRLQNDPLIWQQIFENEPSGFLSATNGTTAFITYPCRSDTVLNCAVFHVTKSHLKGNDDWNSPASIDDVLTELKDWHPAWRGIVQHADADAWKCYTVGMRDVIPRMNNGKAVLIGDAAHPMQPTHAQGGCLGLEDAVALGELFANWSERDNVVSRLELFNQLRLPRNTTTQILSNGMFYAKIMKTDTESLIRKFYQGPILKPSTNWTAPVQDYFYSYDAFREAAKAMEYKGFKDGLPDGVIKHFGRYDGKGRTES